MAPPAAVTGTGYEHRDANWADARGAITFRGRTACIEIIADSEFGVPIQFDTDHMAMTIETYRLHAWRQIPMVELRS
jgi:hypothetical protein